jgi:hypothetical protein
MTRRRRVVRMTRLEEEFEDNIEMAVRLSEQDRIKLKAQMRDPVVKSGAPAPEDPKTLVMRRREMVRNLALALVKHKHGSRASETRVELKANYPQFRELFEGVYPNAGHVMFNNKTTLKRALRDHIATPEWPHIYLKGGRPKKQ